MRLLVSRMFFVDSWDDQYAPLNYFTLKTHDSGRLTTRRAHWMYPDAWTTALLERRMLCGSSEWPWNCGGGAYWTLTCFNMLRPFLHAPPTHNVFFKVVLPWRVHSKSMNLVLFDILICCGVHVVHHILHQQIHIVSTCLFIEIG